MSPTSCCWCRGKEKEDSPLPPPTCRTRCRAYTCLVHLTTYSVSDSVRPTAGEDLNRGPRPSAASSGTPASCSVKGGVASRETLSDPEEGGCGPPPVPPHLRTGPAWRRPPCPACRPWAQPLQEEGPHTHTVGPTLRRTTNLPHPHTACSREGKQADPAGRCQAQAQRSARPLQSRRQRREHSPGMSRWKEDQRVHGQARCNRGR